MSSHDVVAKLRRLTGIKQIGHGGTLDPLAEGVMVVAIGKATRLIRFLNENKTYLAQILLGRATATDDMEGAIIEEKAYPQDLSETALEQVLDKFRGPLSQIPPIYSAIHVNGKRLYDLARKTPEDLPDASELKPREVTVFDLSLKKMELPIITIEVACSKGTYIRSIARDLGIELGTVATLYHLLRTCSGKLTLENSLSLDELEEAGKSGQLRDTDYLNELLQPVETTLDLPKLKVGQTVLKALSLGQKLKQEELQKLQELQIESPPGRSTTTGDYLLLVGEDEKAYLVAQWKDNGEDLRLCPEVVFRQCKIE